MEKREISIKVPYYLEWLDGITLEDLKKDIEELEKLGVNYIDTYYGGDCVIEMEAYIKRLETDEEFKKRMDEEAIRAENKRLKKEMQVEMTKKRELKMLQELKAKYGES